MHRGHAQANHVCHLWAAPRGMLSGDACMPEPHVWQPIAPALGHPDAEREGSPCAGTSVVARTPVRQRGEEGEETGGREEEGDSAVNLLQAAEGATRHYDVPKSALMRAAGVAQQLGEDCRQPYIDGCGF